MPESSGEKSPAPGFPGRSHLSLEEERSRQSLCLCPSPEPVFHWGAYFMSVSLKLWSLLFIASFGKATLKRYQVTL